MTKIEIMEDLKKHIFAELPLEGVDENTLKPDTLLFDADGLGLDSLDAVELVVLLEKHYGIIIKDAEASREIFTSLSTLADFILAGNSAHG
ncbi:MAG: acyl carrier protein [Desulfovibrionaceae bacterium]|nr:acyl carrier protein [Desulfovibrionaceae bacterium]